MDYADILKRDKVFKANLIHYLDHCKKPSLDLSEILYGRELIRLDIQQRKIFDEILREDDFRKRNIVIKDASSSAGINRLRELKRIEKDNQMLQKRIQSAKPQNKFNRKQRNRSEGPPFNLVSQCFNCKRRPEWNDRW